MDKKSKKGYWLYHSVITIIDPVHFFLFFRFLAPLHIRCLGRANKVMKQIVLEQNYKEKRSLQDFTYHLGNNNGKKDVM